MTVQCPAPPGLVDLLLLTRRAVVIFDGLDELLDTSRRLDVTTRVERFCAEYPLAQMLVTSRLVGFSETGPEVGSTLSPAPEASRPQGLRARAV